MGQSTAWVHKMGHLTSTCKCIIYIQNVYILKQGLTSITAMEAGMTYSPWLSDDNKKLMCKTVGNMDTN